MKWIRKKIGWIAAAAVGGFLLWLVGTVVSLRTTQGKEAGTLFGKKVPLSTYLHAMDAVTHQAILKHGDRYLQEVSHEEQEHAAWERLMLLTEARKRGIRVMDQEVTDKLMNSPLFQTSGRFDLKGYESFIHYTFHTTARAFEEEVREDLTISKLFEQITSKLTVSDEELHEGFRQREEAIRVSHLTLPHEGLAREIADAARQDPRQLAVAAKQMNLKLTPSDFFRRDSSILEMGSAGLVFEPAFSLQVGEVTGPLRSPRGWLVAQLQAKEPADERKFGELKESLEKELLAQKRMKAALTWYQDLLKRADLKKSLLVPHPNGD